MSETPRDAPRIWPPVHEIGLSTAELDLHGGAVFWEEVRLLTTASPLAPLVDGVLAAREVPRVWLFLDEPGETITRAAAALAAARALVARRLNVVVVDGDDRCPDLTRWSGRHEREGWIDFVRYGASLASCTVPLPWAEASGRLLGLGSFHPTDATAAEASWLLSLLGSQADVVLVSAPLGPDGALWHDAPALRVLCWDRAGRDPAGSVALLERLAADGRPAHAVVAFGAPGLDLLPPPSVETVEAERRLAQIGATATAAATLPPGPESAAAREPVPAAPAPEPSPPTPPVAAPVPSGPRRRRRLWPALAVLLAAGAVGSWLWSGARPARAPLSSLAPPPAGEDISRPAAPAGAPPDSGRTAAAGADSGAAAAALRDTAVTPPAAAGTAGVPAPGSSPSPGSAPAETVATPRAAAVAPAAAFDPEPFRLPVGRDGWTLHVHSLPDSVLAQRQVAALARLGITARWRAVELPGRGLWYRVYMGSFPDRGAAASALPALLSRLGEGWGQVARF